MDLPQILMYVLHCQ